MPVGSQMYHGIVSYFITWMLAFLTSTQKCFRPQCVNTLRLRQNGRRFPDDIFKCIFLNENSPISIKISLKFVPKSPINNIPSFVQIMAWRRPGGKPLSEPMTVSLLTHVCITRPQWVNPPGAGDGIFWENKSTPWLLMPWLLVSPGHQQPWCWLCSKRVPCLP